MLKHFLQKLYFLAVHPAAFRRLCVETRLSRMTCSGFCQPPSGGCVLKPDCDPMEYQKFGQPPSGGCVLKPRPDLKPNSTLAPAAFRRLCVETIRTKPKQPKTPQPPSGGCVLKQSKRHRYPFRSFQPPSGGCVLKHQQPFRFRCA